MNSLENPMVFHRSWRSIIPSLLFALVATIATAWATSALEISGLPLPITEDYIFTVPIYPLIFLVIVSRPLLRLIDCRHEITNKHVSSHQGLYSLRKQFIEIPYEDMAGVRMSQSLLERILGVGSVIIWTASAEMPDLIMKGIRDPEMYAKIIGRRLDSSNQGTQVP